MISMVFIVLWCLIFNKTSKFWMCKKIETEALQEKKQTKKHQNPQYWQLYILKYSLRPISKKSYLMLQIVNTSILNNFCWLFLKTYNAQNNGPPLWTVCMKENCVHDHFPTRHGIYQSEREHTSRSDLTSGLTSCTQFSQCGSVVQHSKNLKKNVKITFKQTSNW